MKENAVRYVRLPGTAREKFGLLTNKSTSLWLGPDHLLYALNEHFNESYKRFELRDIQALVLNRTRSGAILTAVLLAIAAVFAMGGLGLAAFTEEYEWLILAAVVAAPFVIAVLGNTIVGPTCVCHLRTAVQTERLYCLGRLRSARKTFALLRSAIEAAQGALDPGEMPDMSGVLFAEARPAAPAPRRRVRMAPRTKKPYDGRAHAALFAGLAVFALLNVACIPFLNIPLLVALIIAYLFTVVTSVVALIVQNDRIITKELRTVAWASLAVMCMLYLLGSMYLASFIGEMAGQGFPVSGLGDNAELMVVCIVNAACAGILATFGFVFLARFRRGGNVAGPDALSEIRADFAEIAPVEPAERDRDGEAL